jgi:tetratricopeptide (TPR) repeat protein
LAIKGSLAEAALPEVIQLLTYSLKSGCLSVTDGSNFGNIFLRDGKVIYATILKREERLGDAMVGRRLFDKNILTEALGLQKEKRKRIGEILVEMGAISQHILEEELKHQIEDAIFTMLSWDKGYFNFEAGLLPSPNEHTIELSSQALLLGSARRIATWQEIQEKLPPSGTVLIAKQKIEDSDLNEVEKEILALVDGQKSIDEIVKGSGLPFQDACKAVYVLLTAGIVEKPKAHVERKPVSVDEGEHKNMGLAFYQSTKYDEAKEEFKKVLDHEPGDAESLFYLGMIQLSRDDEQSAKEYLQSAIEREKRVSILVNMGYLLSRMSQHEEARKLLDRALKIEPDNLRAILNRAIANYHLNALDIAARDFERSLEISRDIVTPYLYLSVIYVKEGTTSKAIDLLAEAIERFPKQIAFKNNLALLYESAGKNEDAELLYQQALLLQSGEPSVLRNIANLYYRMGFYGGARDYYERIPENKRDAVTCFKLGRTYLFSGDAEGALAEWQHARTLDPGNDRLSKEIACLNDLVSS